jgi:predicted nucleic acid-binding protein
VRRVFLDSSAFFADCVLEDAHHSRARALFDQSVAEGWERITINAVAFETYTLSSKKARNGRTLALGFLNDIEAVICTVVRIGPEDETNAIVILRDHDDKAYSFCDALREAVV